MIKFKPTFAEAAKATNISVTSVRKLYNAHKASSNLLNTLYSELEEEDNVEAALKDALVTITSGKKQLTKV